MRSALKYPRLKKLLCKLGLHKRRMTPRGNYLVCVRRGCGWWCEMPWSRQ